MNAVRVLLASGANRDAQDARDETPLFVAAKEGCYHAAQLLLSQLERLTKPRDGHRSTVTPHIVRAHELCLQWGCEVVVVGLPMDVQIDASEWAKYRGEPLELAPTQRLLEDLLADDPHTVFISKPYHPNRLLAAIAQGMSQDD